MIDPYTKLGFQLEQKVALKIAMYEYGFLFVSNKRNETGKLIWFTLFHGIKMTPGEVYGPSN